MIYITHDKHTWSSILCLNTTLSWPPSVKPLIWMPQPRNITIPSRLFPYPANIQNVSKCITFNAMSKDDIMPMPSCQTSWPGYNTVAIATLYDPALDPHTDRTPVTTDDRVRSCCVTRIERQPNFKSKAGKVKIKISRQIYLLNSKLCRMISHLNQSLNITP